MKRKFLKNSNGFTLVELMVTVLLTAIAVIAIYRGYTSFSQSADAQQQVIEMQQNLRIGMYTLVRDMIRAGMTEEDQNIVMVDTTRKDVKSVTFLTADASTAEFGMDLGSGGVFASDTEDNDGDGTTNEEDEIRVGDDDFNDDGERILYTLNGLNLERRVWDSSIPGYGAAQTIITNVSGLDFTYVKEDDTVLSSLPLSEADRSLIDTVEITMVVRTTNEDYRITNNESYNNLRGALVLGPQNDNFRRRSMTMRLKIRNANL